MIASLFALALAALPAAAQQPQTQPTFGERVDVNVVLLDAVVSDAQGNQILGLEPRDFVVTENGAEQKIDSVDYYTTRKLLNSTEANAPFKVEQVKEQRYFVFFFDKPEGNELWNRQRLARSAAAQFINRSIGPGDLVAVVGHDVRLKVYSDFTSNKTQLLKAIDDAGRFSKGVLTAPTDSTVPSILRNSDKSRIMDRTGTVYEAIQELASAVRPIRGRKNLVLFSAGIVEPSEEVRDGVLLNRSRFYQPMINALNGADVTVYAANILEPGDGTAPVFHQTLESIAQETNGQYFRSPVSFEPVARSVAKAAAGYYLISYRSPHAAGTSGFQKVNVSIRNHPEFKVEARAGYSYGD